MQVVASQERAEVAMVLHQLLVAVVVLVDMPERVVMAAVLSHIVVDLLREALAVRVAGQ